MEVSSKAALLGEFYSNIYISIGDGYKFIFRLLYIFNSSYLTGYEIK